MTWTILFLEAQGYKMTESLLYQDNVSTELLENNGNSSSSKQTRHMNIHHFFLNEFLDRKEFKTIHCPVKHMVHNYYNKPLHGPLSIKLYSQIVNIKH